MSPDTAQAIWALGGVVVGAIGMQVVLSLWTCRWMAPTCWRIAAAIIVAGALAFIARMTQ